MQITAIQQIGPNTAIVNWDGIGNFPSGFNVVWTNEVRRPISPRDDGSFTNDPFARTSMFSGQPGYVYILRVCRFTGEGCDVYSDTAFFTFRRYAPTPHSQPHGYCQGAYPGGWRWWRRRGRRRDVCHGGSEVRHHQHQGRGEFEGAHALDL